MKTFMTLFKTEMKLSVRGMDMVIFAICMPVVMVVILGVIYGSRPAYAGADYTFLEQSFGAIATIAVCAGGAMGLPLLVSDYRHKKILKRLQVTPVSPGMILAVHVVIYAVYALVSLLLVFLAATLGFGCRFGGSLPLFLGCYFLVMISMFSIGMMVGGLAPDLKSAGIIASVLYFPMLLLSGATLPYEIMPPVLRRAADVLPLTQGIKLVKAAALGLPLGDVMISIAVMVLLAIGCTAVAVKFFRWE